MKFLTKINRNYLVLLMLILLVVSIGGYFILRFIVINEAEEYLLSKEFLIEKQISETGIIPNFYPLVEVKKASIQSNIKPSFKIIYINTLNPQVKYLV